MAGYQYKQIPVSKETHTRLKAIAAGMELTFDQLLSKLAEDFEVAKKLLENERAARN